MHVCGHSFSFTNSFHSLHMRTHTQACTHSYEHTHTCIYIHTHTHTHTPARTHTCTHTYMHAHTYTHTHKHIYTHTISLKQHMNLICYAKMNHISSPLEHYMAALIPKRPDWNGSVYFVYHVQTCIRLYTAFSNK